MGEGIKAGDVVRESGCFAEMTVVGLDGTEAECRYPEPGHPDAVSGTRAGRFALRSLIFMRRPVVEDVVVTPSRRRGRAS